jgi:hypothetical protein
MHRGDFVCVARRYRISASIMHTRCHRGSYPAALTIWLSRHWTIEQLLSKVAELEEKTSDQQS